MRLEFCKNPFMQGRCGSTDICIYIEYKGVKIPICRKCWKKIGDSEEEWGSHEYGGTGRDISPKRSEQEEESEEEEED